MPIAIIKGPEGVVEVVTAVGTISASRAVQFTGNRSVQQALSGYHSLRAGIARESATSGNLLRLITHGIASGVMLFSGVNPGDALQVESASGYTGYVGPFLSGVGCLLGNALNSGASKGSISILVNMG